MNTKKLKKRRFRRRKFNPTAVNILGDVQTMGPGSNTLVVNLNYSYAQGTHKKDPINDAITSLEFNSRKLNYNYFKIRGVRITVFPFTSTNNGMLYQNFKYGTETTLSQDNIIADDSSKVTATYNIKPKSFRFKPPNITFNQKLISGGMVVTTCYNLREWIETKNNQLVSALNVYNSANVTINTQVEVLIIFRGSTFDPSVSKIMKMVYNMDSNSRKEFLKMLESKVPEFVNPINIEELKIEDKKIEDEKKEDEDEKELQRLEKLMLEYKDKGRDKEMLECYEKRMEILKKLNKLF